MQWTEEQIAQYKEQGYLFNPGLLSSGEVNALDNDVPLLLNGEDEKDGLHRERERSGAVRQVYLAHRSIHAFRDLIHQPKILHPVRQILNDNVYIWHTKVCTTI